LFLRARDFARHNKNPVIALGYFSQDTESYRFAQQIRTILVHAGWKVVPPPKDILDFVQKQSWLYRSAVIDTEYPKYEPAITEMLSGAVSTGYTGKDALPNFHGAAIWIGYKVPQ
jgi:hypothetical protein